MWEERGRSVRAGRNVRAGERWPLSCAEAGVVEGALRGEMLCIFLL